MEQPTEPLMIDRDTASPIPLELMAERGGIVLIDKPRDWTSFDVVAKTRGMFRTKKVGHTGTLDPMATGLLILCLGRATKLVDMIQAGEKEYTGTIRLGATTPTDDAESEESERFPIEHITEDGVRAAAAAFVGESMQVAPMFSARKIGGERLYKIARRGETVEIPPKPITVREFAITRIELPEVGFRIVCLKGTYIRALARDLGRSLGSGGYLTELRRTRSGEYHVDQALTIDDVRNLTGGGGPARA